jgi:hypothetical protein
MILEKGLVFRDEKIPILRVDKCIPLKYQIKGMLEFPLF